MALPPNPQQLVSQALELGKRLAAFSAANPQVAGTGAPGAVVAAPAPAANPPGGAAGGGK